MLSRDFPQRNAKVAIFASSHDGHVADNGKTASFAVGAEHDKDNLHRQIPRGANTGDYAITLVSERDLGNFKLGGFGRGTAIASSLLPLARYPGRGSG